MPGVNLKEQECDRRGNHEDDREQEPSDDDLSGALLLGARPGDAEGRDEGFEQPG